MNAAEILFLAIGLCLGIAVGAALLDLIRARPAPREVRLTITRNALPVREPMATGVAFDQAGGSDLRVPIRVARGVDPAYAAIRQEGAPVLVGSVAAGAAVGRSNESAKRSEGRTGLDNGDDPRAMATDAGSGPAAEAPRAATVPDIEAADPCAAQRRLADERCAVAAHARTQAETAATNLQYARRAYDEVAHRIGEAQGRADPRVVDAAKETARRVFRTARDRATSRADLELAAATWLTEINRVNLQTRDARMLIAREEADTAALLASIERQALAADAARITAEAAGEACDDAQAALAACIAGDLEAVARSTAASTPVTEPITIWDRDDGHQPVIVRLLRGETAARERLVAELAGSDPNEQRRHQLWLSELVDGIFAASIETAVLDFPAHHPFWSAFDRSQSRDIVVALASLGYRFDGLGGFSGGRVPGQRELSQAVGYAALDPIRIRHWPTIAEMPDLFREVTVAADEFLATRAPDLDLGEMVAVLGRRSEQLSELWNRWARVRPLLLIVTE
ncbi:MAG: hypothetical protein ABWY52_05275 [Candidatus Limnocylindrales bacterium]